MSARVPFLVLGERFARTRLSAERSCLITKVSSLISTGRSSQSDFLLATIPGALASSVQSEGSGAATHVAPASPACPLSRISPVRSPQPFSRLVSASLRHSWYKIRAVEEGGDRILPCARIRNVVVACFRRRHLSENRSGETFAGSRPWRPPDDVRLARRSS